MSTDPRHTDFYTALTDAQLNDLFAREVVDWKPTRQDIEARDAYLDMTGDDSFIGPPRYVESVDLILPYLNAYPHWQIEHHRSDGANDDSGSVNMTLYASADKGDDGWIRLSHRNAVYTLLYRQDVATFARVAVISLIKAKRKLAALAALDKEHA